MAEAIGSNELEPDMVKVEGAGPLIEEGIGSAARAGSKVLLERELDKVGDTRSLGEVSNVVKVVFRALLAISTAEVSS